MSEKKVKGGSNKKPDQLEDSTSCQSIVIIREENNEQRINLDKELKDIVTGVQPLNYEDEIINKQNEIKRDLLKDILVFPEDDVVLFKRTRELRTEYSTVPPQAFKDATSLFVKECLNVYTCDHYILQRQYDEYGHNFHCLKKDTIDNVLAQLSCQVFEEDVTVDENDGVQDTMLVPTKEKGIYKEGYLTKSPFHSDGNPLFGSKTYKRRWFTLKQTSNDGSYILEYRKEEGSAFAKGTLYLDSCTQITKGVKGRMYGFELHIQDKIYGLAADSLSEMESWIKSLCKATGVEIEPEKPSRALFSGKPTHSKHKNLRESLKNSSHPLLQEYAKETDQGNQKNRQENRLKLFTIYSGLNNSYGVPEIKSEEVEPFREPLCTRFLLQCKELKFKLSVKNQEGYLNTCEPFFLTISLFDIREGKKLSEDFVCDLNDETLKDKYLKEVLSANGSIAEETQKQAEKDRFFHSPKTCVFSVDTPHQDIYLVLRINKLLQGGIGQCTEPYIKSFDNPKAAIKQEKQVRLMSKRLGNFKMPFGWAARPLFKNRELETEFDFCPIYKQETAKLTDEEMVKFLLDLKSDSKLNKTVLPGNLSCSFILLDPNHPNCYSPSLIPLKPFSRSEDIEASLEIQTFCRQKEETATPSTDYVNNFYIYPISLNFASQKAMKARNLACTIQFKDCDNLVSKPLKCIYQRNGTCTFTHQVTCPILYHNTTPTFYEEIKVLLPSQLEPSHHILFTFYHVSVEQPKESKEIMSPVGYCWMAILESGSIVRPDESFLPVASYLPEKYLSAQDAGFGKHTGPDIKWADGKGHDLFKVNTKLVSTIYSQEVHLNSFFTHWQQSEGKASADAEMSRLLKLMHGLDIAVLVKFLPVILNQLFQVLIQVNNEDVAVNAVSLLIRIISIMHEVGKEKFLRSYVKYTFQVDGSKNKTVHEELAKHLIFYLHLGADPGMIANILQHAWFFFDIMVKSMAQVYMYKEHYKNLLTRQNRFKLEYQRSLENLVQVFIYQLVSRAKDKQTVVKAANLNLASFIKNCFTHMDRGYVFHIINYLKDQFKPMDTQMFELKFDFLRSICEHEHYIPLNLPLDIRMKGDVHQSMLNDIFCKKHFLVGLLLREVSMALYEPKVVRKYALRVLRNLLIKHEFDVRYKSEEKQSRIAALYIPYLSMMLEHSIRFHKNLYRPLPDDNFNSFNTVGSERNSALSGSPSIEAPSLMVLDPTGKMPPILPFDDDESREFMISFLYVLKNLRSVIIVDWWRDLLITPVQRPHWIPVAFHYMQQKHFAKFMAIIDFFDLLECCIKVFVYCGKKTYEEKSNSTSDNTKQYLEMKYSSLQKASPSLSSMLTHKKTYSSSSILTNMISEAGLEKRTILESNLSTEVALIVLDMLELFCSHFKFHLEQEDGDNILMKKIFNVMMALLWVPQSEYALKHIFASLRSFIHKFPTALFKGSANICGVLCCEILRLCNSKIATIQTQACCFMYLLMRTNFEYSGSSCVRVHHQLIVAVSKLIASGMNRASMSNSLTMLKTYAVEDKGMKKTEFPTQVRDLIKKVHTVLQATSQMKEHEDDHEVLVDLQYSLAKSYSSTPELRQTWLQSMANIHEKNGDFSEAAMCYIHAAALVAGYLKGKGCFPGGCTLFKSISPNLVPDESVIKDDEGEAGEMRYTTKHLLDLLEICVGRLKKAERYEVMGEVYKLAIPLYEQDRNYQGLAIAYGTLKESYEKIVEVMVSGKRILGRYYRVAFYGRVFKDSDGKEFIYKEPKLTSLPEISHRLSEKYDHKYGNVKLIQDSSKVKPEELNPAVNYIQVTFVQPYFDEEEYSKRLTEFERENNIRRFIFETPFTLSGKAHGQLAEQHKRKTILTTSHSFPYVKKRLLVVQQEIYELSPLEVAIDEMQSKVKELNHVISLDPPDMKKLQLKLGGSVSVQVNAGPLAYAQTFLDESVVKNYVTKHIEALQQTYREFVRACGQALELNSVLIKPDQVAYHEDLKERYFDLKTEVAVYAGDEIVSDHPVITSPSHSDV